MPEAIAQIEHALAAPGPQNAVTTVKVGYVGHERAKAAVFRLGAIAFEIGHFELAKKLAEPGLLVVADLLPAENEHAVIVNALFDGLALFTGDWFSQVNTGYFADKVRMDPANTH